MESLKLLEEHLALQEGGWNFVLWYMGAVVELLDGDLL